MYFKCRISPYVLSKRSVSWIWKKPITCKEESPESSLAKTPQPPPLHVQGTSRRRACSHRWLSTSGSLDSFFKTITSAATRLPSTSRATMWPCRTPKQSRLRGFLFAFLLKKCDIMTYATSRRLYN